MKWQTFKVAIKKAYLLSCMEALQQSILYYFIPGTYRREWINKDIKTEETICITRLSHSSSLYRLTKKVVETSYIEDKLMTITKLDAFYAGYNKSAKVLIPTTWEDFLLFYPEENLLIIANLEYKKVDL